MYSAGHIPYRVGLEDVLSAGMNEIAHIEDLTWEWIDFDRDKELQGFSWIPYVIGTAFQQYVGYKEYDIEKLKTVFDKKVSETVEKLLVFKTPVL
ncbi:MAG: hypothetical protein PF503_20545 [Desulfobacula sp.]|jgi:hypothetical protein|nr:hypothetical protein [Desulfobacula sp.]